MKYALLLLLKYDRKTFATESGRLIRPLCEQRRLLRSGIQVKTATCSIAAGVFLLLLLLLNTPNKQKNKTQTQNYTNCVDFVPLV